MFLFRKIIVTLTSIYETIPVFFLSVGLYPYVLPTCLCLRACVHRKPNQNNAHQYCRLNLELSVSKLF